MELLEDLPPGQHLNEGIEIGFSDHAGARRPVCIPEGLRAQHVHLIGRSGTGKSSVMETMVLQDIEKGHGVVVLDPHGPLVQRVLCLLPESQIERVIYINPGDLDWIPIWNPLRSGVGAEPGRVTDDIVSAFKSFVTGWGDRLEHLLRHAIYGVLHLPEGSLLDVSNILRRKAPEARALRRQVAELVDNEVARRFWRDDFGFYKDAEGFISRVTRPPASHADFNALIAGLCRHLQASALPASLPLPPGSALDEAMALLDQSYEGVHANGYYAALLDALDASPEGVQLVLARLAELIKARQRSLYVRWVITRNITLVDWDTKRALADLLLRRCRPWLPPEMQHAVPEQFTDCIEDLLIADLSADARLGRSELSDFSSTD